MMKTVLCSTTARIVLNALADGLPAPLETGREKILATRIPTKAELRLIRETLMGMGVRERDAEVIDVLVGSRSKMRWTDEVHGHIWEHGLPSGSLMRLVPGLYVVGPELCALMAARDMSELELVEYYFELCSTYAMPCDPQQDYRDLKRPRTTTERLKELFCQAPPRCRGRGKAMRALRAVRDGARSPMETAMVMPMTVRRELGGLGLRDLEMNRRIELTGEARRRTRRSYLIADAYVERGRQDIEYQGARHSDPVRVSIDNERRCALQAMGYRIVEVGIDQLLDPVAFSRLMDTVGANAGQRITKPPKDYAARRERLRRFVTRRWLEGRAARRMEV